MRFIPTRVHGLMDYMLGILLIAAPWVLGFAGDDMAENGAETWVPVIIGAGIIVASLMTAYEYGVANIISMSAHLGLDVVAGIVLAVSPWLFGFYEEVWAPHLIFGLLEAGAGLMTKTTPTEVPVHAGARRDTGLR